MSLEKKFNNSHVTKWYVVCEEGPDDFIYTAKVMDRSGSLNLYGVYDSPKELISVMDEEEEPFNIVIRETTRVREPGILPMNTSECTEEYDVRYGSCLNWHLEEFGIPNNMDVTMSRYGLDLNYGTLAGKQSSERLFKSVVRLYANPESAALKGSLYTDNWSMIAYEIEKRSVGLIDGPMDMSYIHRDDDGMWCSWDLKNETIIGLMLELTKLGAIRHRTNTMYSCLNKKKIGRLTKGIGRAEVRSAVFSQYGKGVISRHEEGRVFMAIHGARYTANGNEDAFNPQKVPSSFKSVVGRVHYGLRNKKEYSRI